MKNPFKKQPEPALYTYGLWATAVKFFYENGYPLKELVE